ncbi:MAG: hypothetical protein IJP23_00420 [Oscillospiraceae bacterium]|nr:hypothetical protein [Oscillospiraceae bacterium]
MADNKNQNSNSNSNSNSASNRKVKSVPSTMTPSTQSQNKKGSQSCK